MSTFTDKSSKQLLDDLIAELEISVGTVVGAESSSSKASKSTVEKSNSSKKGKDKPAATKSAPAEDVPITVNSMELRVGKIVSVTKHETADKLYCEMIDIGEAEPRAIASGLVPHYSLEDMQDRRIIVICNLSPRKLVGFKSFGMVLCAAKVDATTGAEKVEFIDPPADAAIGERLVGKDIVVTEPVTAKQCDKKKVWENIAADLKVNGDGILVWKDIEIISVDGKARCSAPTVRDCIAR